MVERCVTGSHGSWRLCILSSMLKTPTSKGRKPKAGDAPAGAAPAVRTLVLDGETYRMVPERAFQQMMAQIRQAQAEDSGDAAAIRKAMTSGTFRSWDVVKRTLANADGKSAARKTGSPKAKARG